MKVVIVNPIYTLGNLLPTNLAELAGYIRAHGYSEIAIVDLNYELRKEFDANRLIERSIAIIMDQKPDVIGITCHTIHVPFCVELCREYKQRFKTPVVLGGIHPTFRTRQMLQLTKADYIVRGEGEETFLELLDALRDKKQVNGIRGCSFRRGDKIIHNPDRPLIRNLSMLPFPAYDLLLPYIQRLSEGSIGARKDMDRISVVASRGCPFGCIFCSSSKMWRYQRRKSVARVIEEIRYLTEKCRKKEVYIEDDCFNLNKKWLGYLLREIKKLNITWFCAMRIDMMDSDLLKRMQKAGCRGIYHGLESGSAKIRSMLGKGFSAAVTNDLITDLVSQEIKLGISSTCSFMTGIPGETKEDFNDTVNLCVELQKSGANIQFWIMTPYPDITAIRKHRNKLIKIDRWKILRQTDIFATDQFFLYHKFYHKYTRENPDFYMFKPDMKLSWFLKAYKESYRAADTSMGSYVTEETGQRYLIAGPEKLQIGNISGGEKAEGTYISLEYPFLNTHEMIRNLRKIKPQRLFLSIKGSDRGSFRETRSIIFRFLRALMDKNVQINLTRPIPLGVFNARQRSLMKGINMPKNCRDCYELFKVNKRGKIELCTGWELFKKEFMYSREDIVYLFHRIVLLDRNPANCVFSSRQEIIKFFKKKEDGGSCRDKAKAYFSTGSYEEAIKYFMKAERSGYDGWDLYYYLGLCYEKKRDFGAALDNLKKAEEINPSEYDVHSAMARCHKIAGDFEAMWTQIKKGLKLRPPSGKKVYAASIRV